MIHSVLTFAEAAERWNLNPASLRHAVRAGRFTEDEVRKSGKVWLVTVDGMKRLYGEPKQN